MTGPNPDAELDEALGVDQLPPAAVTDAHITLALAAMYPRARFTPGDVHELSPPAPRTIQRIAQAIADAEQRGAVRTLTEHAIAGTAQVDAALAGVPGAAAPGVELANVRRLLDRHGIPPADGNGVIRSTVAMVEEALIQRPPA